MYNKILLNVCTYVICIKKLNRPIYLLSMHISFISKVFFIIIPLWLYYCFIRQHSMNKTINVTKYPIRRITAKGAIWVRLMDLAWLGSHCSSVFIVQCNIIFWCKIPSSLILNIWKLNNFVNGQSGWKIIPRNSIN